VLEVIGILAGILILSGWVKQTIWAYRNKSLSDFSLWLFILILCGVVFWLLYGVLNSDIYIIGTNIASITIMGLLIYMKRRYDKCPKREEQDDSVELGDLGKF